MALKNSTQSRRDFLKVSAGIAGGIGVLAFPAGLGRAFDDVSPGGHRRTYAHPAVLGGNTSPPAEGGPVGRLHPP